MGLIFVPAVVHLLMERVRDLDGVREESCYRRYRSYYFCVLGTKKRESTYCLPAASLDLLAGDPVGHHLT